MLQAGYAGGLLFIVPAGDIVRRRPFVLLLILGTAIMVSDTLFLPPWHMADLHSGLDAHLLSPFRRS